MSAVNSSRLVALVLAGGLLSACAANGTEPHSPQRAVAVNTTPAATSGPLAATGTNAPADAGPQMANASVSVITRTKRRSVDVIDVTKCYTNAKTSSGGQMLIKASSSDRAARLFAYRPDGILIGQIQNGGGNRYGGTVISYQPYDPIKVTIKSSAGGKITVPTTPFKATN